jgi:glutamyl-tRNA synthetase
MTTNVRVRFAPSPTGFLHVGGLRTALYNYLFARHHGGKFILRIEDTDQSRRVEGAVENLISTLEWSGVHYDEGPGIGGPFGPYVQSERLEIYRQHANELVKQGRAYHCFCTPERLDGVRQRQTAAKERVLYDGHCRELAAEEVRERLGRGERNVIRMKVPSDGAVTFRDLIRGEVSIGNEILDDQVLLKSDGFPTYHLAVVVDDHSMQISHVIRGEEWLPSTPKHVLLYQYFGWELPIFAHLPLLLNPDKSKLSKRQGDVAVEDYRAKGYFKEALVNFIAFLGWNPGDERELFTLEELVQEFSLDRVGKAGAVFNVEKLNWLNFQHLKKKSDQEIMTMLREHLAASGIDAGSFSDTYLLGVIAAMKERATFLHDFVEKSPYFYKAPVEYDADVVKKRWKPESAAQMEVLAKEFSHMGHCGKEDFEAALHRAAASLNIKNSELIHPLRLALSGMGAGPGLYDIAFLLGKDESVKRIYAAIEKLH